MKEKQWYAYSMPKGINLIEGDKMPVMKYWPEGTPMLTDYEKAIERAIASGTPVPDKEKAKDLIEKLRIDLGADAKVWDSYMGKNGAIYGPFTVGYRIEDACAHDSCPVDATCEHCKEPVKVAILYDDTPEKDHDTVLKEFADKMSKQEDIPKSIQAVVNKRFWDMLDTPEKEESQEEGIRLLEKCDRTFESLRKIVIVLKEAEPEKLPELVHNIEIDFQGIQAVIRDYTRKQ